MRISIITPSYNQGSFIRQTIDSVLDQNYKDLEYIVVDGGSTDNTIDILKSYGNSIKWTSGKDKGQTDAINKGMKQATGDVVAFLNSDDYYLPKTLKIISKFFKKNNQAKWVTGDYIIVNQEGKEIHKIIRLYKKLLRIFPWFITLSIVNMIVQPSTFWRKNVLDEVGYFDENLNYTMDYEFWLRLIKNYQLYTLSEKLCAFRIHQSSKGGSRYHEQFDEELRVLKEKSSNKVLQKLHSYHNKLIVAAYDRIK